VHFQQGNILAADVLPGAEIYDAIFCRNVLIYFDRETQDRAVKVLQRLLKPGGVLFVGTAESGLLLSHNFISAKIPLAFAFRRCDAARLDAHRQPTHPARPRVPRIHGARLGLGAPVPSAVARPFKRVPVPVMQTLSAPVIERQSSIDEAVRLADQGRHVEAARLCEEHVRAHGPSAQTCHLLGLIRNAAGNLAEAVEYFRKALYLDPNHYEALVHLTFVLEKQGDAAGARVLRSRVQRLALQAGKVR
jgi:chemotaxis protein methyltransferase WspC